MNAKTWQTFGGFGFPLFLAVVVIFFIAPLYPSVRYLGYVCFVLLAALGCTGARYGILRYFERCYLGCPFCNARSRVTGGSTKELHLECPSCGSVRVTCRPFRTAIAIRLIEETDQPRGGA